jgi:outer membrane protein assembly factor BamA
MVSAHRRAIFHRRVGCCAAVIAAGWRAIARAEPEPVAPKTELGAVPLLGGDSDFGFGGGALGSLTWLEPRHQPYRRRLEVGGIATFKRPSDGWEVPYQDYYLLWTDPHLIRNRLRLDLRPSYTNEANQLYYGIGNASVAPEGGPEGEAERDYFQYGRMHPTLLARVRAALGGGFFALTGFSLTYNRIDMHARSRLEQDATAPGGPLPASFRTLDDHVVALFEYALLYDTRDDETSTHEGFFHQVKLRLSPGGSAAFPYRYGQFNATVRFYTTPVRRWLTIAVRVVGDAQFGDPPFYELARFEDTFAIGGGKGVRGVPAQRYYGKLKAFGNLEARSEVVRWKMAAKDYSLGVVAFLDGGRLWTDGSYRPELDGTGIGLKWGVGGGLRFQQGTAFVVRADVAWSPDATPISAYFTAGQLF